MPSKPLYAGDPNATLTMCYAKRRRHVPKDIQYFSVAKLEGQESAQPKVVLSDIPIGEVVGVVCRHCKENPSTTNLAVLE